MNQFSLKNEVATLLLLSLLHYPLTFFARNLRESQLSDVVLEVVFAVTVIFLLARLYPPPETGLIQIRKPITLSAK